MWKAVLVILSAAALAGGAIIKARPAALPAARPAAPLALGYSGGDYLEQKLDHFNPTELRTWNQRYSSWNISTTKTDGPAFILLKGQEPIGDGLELYGSFARDLADQLLGPSFILEHRFYSDAPADHRTTQDMKLENLRYLTVDQALADIAYFISYIRKTAMIGPNAKVVLYGGEYAGNLATWARLKYPHLVHAAVASSAPLRAQLGYAEYMVEVMKKLDQYGGQKCGNVVRDVVDYVEKQSKTEAGMQGLISTFKLCTPFGAKKWDVDMLLQRIATNLVVGLVNQINVDDSYDNVAAMCAELRKPWTPKGKAQKAAEVMMMLTEMDPATQCLDADYDRVLAPARVEQWGAVDQTGELTFERAILYQACFELGSFPTLSIWNGRYPLDLSLQKCKDVFGAAFDKKALDKAVDRLNEEYGGDMPAVQRVVFVRGGADPNNVRGVLDGLEDMDPVITIPDRAACTDMTRENPRLDTDELMHAHALIKERVVKYLAMTD